MLPTVLVVAVLLVQYSAGQRCTASTDTNYKCMHQQGVFTLHWKIQGNSATFMLESPGSGWLGLGFPDQSCTSQCMVGSKAVIGVSGDVRTYNLGGKSVPQVTEDTTQEVSGASSTEASGKRMLIFTRPLDNSKGQPALTPKSVVFVVGRGGSTFPQVHTDMNMIRTDLREVQAPECTPSTVSEYTCETQGDIGSTLRWKYDSGSDDLSLQVEAPGTTGYLALGIPNKQTCLASNSDCMPGAEAVSGQETAPKTRTWELVGRSPTTGSFQVASPSFAGINGTKILSFVIKAGITTGRKNAVNLDSQDFIVAMAPTDMPSRHTQRGYIKGVGIQAQPATVTTPTPTPAPTPACEASTLSGYVCQIRLSGTETLHWSRMTQKTTYALTTTQNGWIAFGFAQNMGSMAPMEGIAGWAGANPVRFYVLQHHDRPIIDSKLLPQVSASFSRVNGLSTLQFEEAAARNALVFNWAVNGDSQNFPAEQHKARGSFSINLVLGTGFSIARDADDMKAHAALMVSAWAFIVPVGYTVKALGRFLPNVGSYPLAFLLHVILMSVALILSTAGFALAVDKFTGHVSHSHKELGYAVFITSWVQFIGGAALRPDQTSPYRKYFNVLHGGFGRAVHIIAIVAMFMGVKNVEDLYPDEDEEKYLIAIIVGVVIAGLGTLVGLAVRLTTPKESPSDPVSDTAAVPPSKQDM